MSLPAIPAEMRTAVAWRAEGRCEYCKIPERATLLAHEVDHVIATQHGGATILENLALACFQCNRRKGPNIATLHPGSQELIRLFNPRLDDWNRHFQMEEYKIVPVTSVAEATASLLQFNSPQRLQTRRALMESGLWMVV